MQNLQPKYKLNVAICLILAISALLRAYHLFHGIGFHPDERGIQMILSDLSWQNLNAKNFHYGSFAYYLCWLTGQFLSFFITQASSYDFCFLIGRVYAVVFGLGAIYFTYILAKFLTKDLSVSLLSAFLLGTNIFHLQLSRFYTVDILLTAISTAAIYSCCRFLYDKRWNKIFALLLGLAFTNKISALTLLVPYLVALIVRACRQNTIRFSLHDFFVNTSQAIAVSLSTILIVEPFLFLDFDKFIEDNQTQISMVKGLWIPPYTIQYIGTIPYLYHLEQIFFYTLGVPVSLLALAGFLFAIKRIIKNHDSSFLILLSWLLVVFISIAGQQVKFPRYLLPLYPIFVFLAAFALGEITNIKLKKFTSAFLVLISFVQAIGWMKIYHYPHAYQVASEWIYKNIPKGSNLGSMHWDDRLPLDSSGYQNQEINIYEEETTDRREILLKTLSEIDYLILPTAKMYNAIPNRKERYPYTSKFIKALFDSKLGYKLVSKIKTYPLFHLDNSLADESLSLYDHPKVSIFKNEQKYNPEKLNQIIQNTIEMNDSDLKRIKSH